LSLFHPLRKAVRIEEQGQGNNIHVSHETAELIQQAGKEHWVVPREKSEAGTSYWLAAAKGKDRRLSCTHSPSSSISDGSISSSSEEVVDLESDDEANTSGINLSDDDMSVVTSDTGFTFSSSISQFSAGHSFCGSTRSKAWTMQDILTAKEQRLIEWTVDQLSLMLKKIVVRRNAIHRYEEGKGIVANASNSATPPILCYTPPSGMVLDEVQEMVIIPRYDDALLREDALHDASSVELGDLVVEELTNFVTTVTTFYYDPSRNPFHNFMHASHVLMSVVKMMQRIVSPSQARQEMMKSGQEKEDRRGRRRKPAIRRALSMEELHDHTYGITADPLTQFAVVFAALIHDLDHPGVPNATLAQEKTRLARVYNNRSISEQVRRIVTSGDEMAWSCSFTDIIPPFPRPLELSRYGMGSSYGPQLSKLGQGHLLGPR
jgi:3'5'-cyclic nucleotide phosphodiesterase